MLRAAKITAMSAKGRRTSAITVDKQFSYQKHSEKYSSSTYHNSFLNGKFTSK
jgi:hypothetical protein